MGAEIQKPPGPETHQPENQNYLSASRHIWTLLCRFQLCGIRPQFNNQMLSSLKHTTILSACIILQLIVQVFSQVETGQPKANPPTQTAFRYYIFTEQCFDTFFTHHNFLEISCLKITISKLLSYGIIVGATIVKVPQIIKIIKNRSTYGVSFESVFLEEITQIASVAYNIYRNNPFSIYGETLLITYQMMVIHVLFIILDKDNRLKASLLFPPIVAFFLIGYYPEWNLFPSHIFEHMIVFQMVIFSAARLAQIYEIHKIKSTGSVSLITYGLSVLGNIARIATGLVEVKDDYKLILSFFLAFALNAYITACFFIFKQPIGSKQEKKEGKSKKLQ